MSKLNKKDHSPYMIMIKNMMVDYVINDVAINDLMTKYHLTSHTVYEILKVFKFREKKVKYQDQILERSLKKLSNSQSTAFVVATNILKRQMERLQDFQLRNPDKLLDSNKMKEVIGAFALLSKEYRLDNGQATDNQNITIKVDMGSHVPIISENHLKSDPNIVDVPQEDIKEEVKKVEQKQTEDVEVVINQHAEDMFGVLDD